MEHTPETSAPSADPDRALIEVPFSLLREVLGDHEVDQVMSHGNGDPFWTGAFSSPFARAVHTLIDPARGDV